MSRYFTGFFLKLSQTILSLIVLLIQTNTMSILGFATIALLYTFAFATSFLDFGVATRFIHDHFSEIKNETKGSENEQDILREVFGKYKSSFVIISFFHSLLGVIFIGILELFTVYHFDFYQVVLFELSCFTISFSSLVSKTFIAMGEIDILLRNQLYGVSLQFAFMLFFSFGNIGVNTMILVLCIPSIVIFERGIRRYRLKIIPTKNAAMIFSFPNLFRENLSAKVQMLQGIQYLGTVIFPLIAAKKFSISDFANFSVQFRLFFTLAAILGTMNLLEWRNNYINQETTLKKQALIARFLVAMIAACVFSVLAYSMWRNLGFSLNSRPEILSWFFWSVFTGLQLSSWRIYYVILALQNYMKLILAGVIQLLSSIGLLLLPAFDQPLILPIALGFGLTLGLCIMLSSVLPQKREI